MQEFLDHDGVCVHDDFQQWRQNSERGYFLNCRAPNDVMLHKATCTHVGETDEGEEVWGSMTHRKKVCGEDLQELSDWARQHKMGITTCSSCRPLATTSS